jgi:hypothetical protein
MITNIKRIGYWSIALALFGVLLFHSCANPGAGPSGGLKDTIPPRLLNSTPLPGTLQFSGKNIVLDYNELVLADKLDEVLVVSPPLASRPEIKTRGRSIVLTFKEDLIPDRTYSVDFKTGIKDNNEGNPIEPYRMTFSTGDQLDSLRISGHVIDAYTLVPLKDALVTIYELEHDSVFRRLRPDYVARTDDKGFYMFDNLQSKSYKVYALVDGDNNLFYSQESEAIGFIDSLLKPTAQFVPQIDTIINGKDTLITSGYVDYFPSELYHRMFTEKFYNQYLTTHRRSIREGLFIQFNEALADSFHYELVNSPLADSIQWVREEFSARRDSVFLWITDPEISKKDTLRLKVEFSVKTKAGLDSLQTDTLQFLFVEPVRPKSKKEEQPVAAMKIVDLSHNVKGKFNLNETLQLKASLPISEIDLEKIQLKEQVNDSTFLPVTWKLETDSVTKRAIKVPFKLKEKTNYVFETDTAAFVAFNGAVSMPISLKIATQEADFYGSVIVQIEGAGPNSIVQLLKVGKDEELIQQRMLTGEKGQIVFDYLAPDKYMVKLIDDANKNGKWDTGRLSQGVQPERVFYFSKVLKVKSNWELKEKWIIDLNKIDVKNVTDDDAPAKPAVPNR